MLRHICTILSEGCVRLKKNLVTASDVFKNIKELKRSEKKRSSSPDEISDWIGH